MNWVVQTCLGMLYAHSLYACLLACFFPFQVAKAREGVMEFLLAGATAVQIGTANFYNPGLSNQLIRELPAALTTLGAGSVAEVVGTLQIPKRD